MQISQAPSIRVQECGLPFYDASGKKLKEEWYQISEECFYDEDLFYITSIGHCYPGKASSGDKIPPYEFKHCKEQQRTLLNLSGCFLLHQE